MTQRRVSHSGIGSLILVIFMVSFLALGGFFLFMYSNSSGGTSPPSSQTIPVTPIQPSPQAPTLTPVVTNQSHLQLSPPPLEEPTRSEPTWRQVATFSGQGDTNTVPFTINGEQFRITWKYTSDSPEFSALIVSVTVPGAVLPVSQGGGELGSEREDIIYVYTGQGTYFLQILATNLKSWNITVEEIVT